jgi:hypothetical protein
MSTTQCLVTNHVNIKNCTNPVWNSINCSLLTSNRLSLYSRLYIWQENSRLHTFWRLRLTINVPVVFMALYVMVLRGATSLRGALEGVGPEDRDFFGISISAIKTTGTLVVYVPECCCVVLLCVLCVVVCKRGGDVSL